ncbi:MAG: hypothetical protein H0X65_08055 [Gemmatimonadetes bacterium]|nr:hypothetical protein [Gemmatimonadota bacterium]
MRPNTFFIIAVLAFVLLAPPAAAQAGADTVRLSLQEAVTRAMVISEEVQMARAQRSLAEAQIMQIRSFASRTSRNSSCTCA